MVGIRRTVNEIKAGKVIEQGLNGVFEEMWYNSVRMVRKKCGIEQKIKIEINY